MDLIKVPTDQTLAHVVCDPTTRRMIFVQQLTTMQDKL